jgi:hypothetical protein
MGPFENMSKEFKGRLYDEREKHGKHFKTSFAI